MGRNVGEIKVESWMCYRTHADNTDQQLNEKSQPQKS